MLHLSFSGRAIGVPSVPFDPLPAWVKEHTGNKLQGDRSPAAEESLLAGQSRITFPFDIAFALPGGRYAGFGEPLRRTNGEWIRTFAIITVPANELVAAIHDRMPAILHREDYDRWLGIEPDPRDALHPFPSRLLKM
jgi:hypothetical protein